MKILFTKLLDEKEIAKVLGNQFSVYFKELISTKTKNVQPFSLTHHSLIFSSVNGVDAFLSNGFKQHLNVDNSFSNQIYCVGEKAKNRLVESGFEVFKVANTAKELSDFIVDERNDKSFIHFCGNLALDTFQELLALQKIDYRKVVVYETELKYPKIDEYYDAAVFFSPSGVKSFIKNNDLNFKSIFAIGETTSAELKKYTHQEIKSGEKPNLGSLLQEIKNISKTQS